MRAKVAFFSIATNGYLDYWIRLFDSLQTQSESPHFYLCTDEPERARSYIGKDRITRVEVIEIPSLGWPEATLQRYEYIAATDFKHPIVAYIDSDMLVVDDNLTRAIRESNQVIHFVRHPGYHRLSLWSEIKLLFTQPRRILEDFRGVLRHGAIGSWEDNPSSTAFVPKSLRRNYVCGGIWWGPTKKIVSMSAELVKSTELDRRNSVMAVWHDESHLNCYFAKNRGSVELMSSEFCFSRTSSRGMIPAKVIAVDKD